MKLSKFINQLQELVNEYGDIDVYLPTKYRAELDENPDVEVHLTNSSYTTFELAPGCMCGSCWERKIVDPPFVVIV